MDVADNECDKLNKEGDIVWDQVMKQVDDLKLERRISSVYLTLSSLQIIAVGAVHNIKCPNRKERKSDFKGVSGIKSLVQKLGTLNVKGLI